MKNNETPDFKPTPPVLTGKEIRISDRFVEILADAEKIEKYLQVEIKIQKELQQKIQYIQKARSKIIKNQERNPNKNANKAD